MIVTVTLNAAVDKTYRIEGFQLDRVHRPGETRVVAGGKGVNVARVLKTLGRTAIASGFLGGYNGRYIERSLHREGIAGDFERTRRESRVCIAIVDPVSGTQTEINEPGPVVTHQEVGKLLDRVERLLAGGGGILCICGSAPPGVPVAVYPKLVELAAKCGARCVLDASGAALREGMAARPWMVKPNALELGDVLGRAIVDRDAALSAALEVRSRGIEMVAVTLGRDGAVCAVPGSAWSAASPKVPAVSAVGSGDAFLAGFLDAWLRETPAAEWLRSGIAAGAANAMVYGAGFCTAAQIDEVRPQVMVQPQEG